MLQILLAIIGMTMAGALGFALMEQSNAQGVMSVSREDNRRLDLAADVLTRKLIEIPGLSLLTAPLPGSVSGGYATLPLTLKVINTNSQGVAFHYCPLTPSPVDLRSQYPGRVGGAISYGGSTNYSFDGHNGGVIWENANIDAVVRQTSPVAMITSALKGSNAPPPCSAVRMVNGRATVANGIVRLIHVPGQAVSSKQGGATQVAYYVTQNGSGDKSGKDNDNTTPAEDAWKSIYTDRPAAAVIYLNDNITTGRNFSDYIRSPVMRNTDLQIIGNGLIAGRTITLPANVNWPIYGSVTLYNLSVSTIQMVVVNMGKLQLASYIKVFPTSSTDAPISVHGGGTLTIKGAEVAVDFAGQTSQGVIHSAGNVTMQSSYLMGTGQPPHLIVTYTGGSTILLGSYLGKTRYFGAARPTVSLFVQGNGRLTAENTKVLRGTTGRCLGSDNNSGAAFLWSADGAGAYTGVRSEENYPAPASTASPRDWSTYSDGVTSRRRAREQNIGGIDCVEDIP